MDVCAVRELIGLITIRQELGEFRTQVGEARLAFVQGCRGHTDRLRVLSDGETMRFVEGKLAFRPRPLPRAPALSAFDSL